ncbi:disulfide bond formation protein B [Sphingomicrobium astaxanthinifaciens]|uniref:disulfide bond formation protein B n=1 Tax=Sphingomicrobium astaxanthinifaciens TaxID=1227949 RepID=UPI001FCB7A0E|nr:disulfide bond formation protein B [Sphingomicrobium astaxanthinifaciens]MCJ7421524.1 disulfide bond formation protein B [Sphingomicrobium astaxanthinifaciens]
MLAPARPRSPLLDLRTAHGLALLVPAALLAGAIGSQLIGGLVPCEMCIWQRWPHAIAIALALLAIPLARLRRPLVLLAGLAIAVSGGIGVYHAGVELGWFEGLTRCASNSGGTLAELVSAPVVRCDSVQWSLLGISMAGWNAILSLAAAGLVLVGGMKGRA